MSFFAVVLNLEKNNTLKHYPSMQYYMMQQL